MTIDSKLCGKFFCYARHMLSRGGVLYYGLVWLFVCVVLAIFVLWLQMNFGSMLEYPYPSIFSGRGIVYLVFSMSITVLLSRSAKTMQFAVPWIVISLVAGTCFYPFLFCGKTFVITNFLNADWAYPLSQVQPPARLVNPEPHDSSMLYFPLKYFWEMSIRKYLSFPFWDFSRNSGMPYAAATLSGAFYPLNLIFLLTGTETGWGLLGILHLLVAGCGMFLLVERLTSSRFAALYAALSFMLMPYLAGWSRSLVWNSTGVWLPLICYFTLVAVTQLRIRFAVLAAVTLTLATLGGWIQWVIYFYLLLGLFIMQYLAVQWTSGQRRIAINSGAVFTLIVVLGLLLSIIHLGPFSEVSRLQPRNTVPWEQVAGISFPFGFAANLAYLVPDLFGNHVGSTVASGWSLLEFQRYLGVFCFPLILLAFTRRETVRIALFLIIPGLFFYSTSTLGTAYHLLYKVVPGFDSIPSQQIRALFVFEFILLLLAGLGAANVYQLIRERPVKLAIMALIWAVLYLSLALLVMNDVFDLQLPHALRTGAGLRTLIIFGLFLLASLAFLVSSKRRSKVSKLLPYASQIVILVGCATELIVEHHRLASFSAPLSQEVPPVVNEIREGGGGRIFRTGGLMATHSFIQNTAALMYGLNDTAAHDSVYLENYARFLSLFNPQTNYRNPHALLTAKGVEKSNVELIRLLNVDYIFHKEDVNGSQVGVASFDHDLVEYIRKDGGRHVLRLRNSLPRAFYVEGTAYLPNNEIVTKMSQPDFKATGMVYLTQESGSDAALLAAPLSGREEIQYSQHGPNSFVLHYKSESERPVFISNVMYPGWRAQTGEGKLLPIHQANLAFMSITVPPSQQGTVIFTFLPSFFWIYVVIFCVSLFISAVLLWKPSIFSIILDRIRGGAHAKI